MSHTETEAKGTFRGAWLVVALLFPVALLNYLDRQMIASMKSSVVADIPMNEARGAEAKAELEAKEAEAKLAQESKVSAPETLDQKTEDQKAVEQGAVDPTPSESVAEPAKKSYVNTNWGHMLGQFKWVYAFFSPIGGFIADRFSRRFTICASLAVWSIVTFVTGTVTTYEGLLWTRTLMGVSEAFYIPAALALISDYHVGSTRSKAVGIHQMGIYCGVILGGFSGYAADSAEFGWRWAFKWIGLLGLIYAIPLIAMLRDVRANRDSVDQPSTPLLETLGTLLGNLSFILLVLYFTLPAMAGWVIRDWMPSLLKDSFPEIGQGLAGVSATIWQVAAIVAAVGGGFLADYWMLRNRRGRIYVSAIGMSLLIPALIFVGQATSTGGSLTMAVGALILFGLGWGFFDCNNMPILCQIVRPQFRATGYGIMNLVSISCGGFADRIFGVLKDREVPMFTIFGLFASVCIVSVILVLLIRPTLTEESNSP